MADVAAIEEIGSLGMALGCAFVMPSIVGEALNQFGTEDQKREIPQAVPGGEARGRRGPDRTQGRV